MKKLYDLWVKYCPIPKLLGLGKKKVNIEPIAPYKLKRTNKTKLIEMANEYGLSINDKMTKNQIIDKIVKFYHN